MPPAVTAERKAFEAKFHQLWKFYHRKNVMLKTKQTNFMDQNRIDIFKGDDFIKYSTQFFQEILTLLPEECKPKDVPALAKYLIDNKLIIRIERLAVDPGARWPKRTCLGNNQRFSDDGFFTWNLSVKSKMNNLKIGIILLLVFLIFLFPIWPYSFKYFIFKLSLYLSIAMIALIVVRYIVYIISRLLGYSFWILPNLNDDSNGILGSFVPLYSIYRWNDGKVEIIFRLAGALGLVFLVAFLFQQPQYVSDFSDSSSLIVDDMLDWGRKYLEGNHTDHFTKRAIPDLSDIAKQFEDINETATPGANSTDL